MLLLFNVFSKEIKNTALNLKVGISQEDLKATLSVVQCRADQQQLYEEKYVEHKSSCDRMHQPEGMIRV